MTLYIHMTLYFLVTNNSLFRQEKRYWKSRRLMKNSRYFSLPNPSLPKVLVSIMLLKFEAFIRSTTHRQKKNSSLSTFRSTWPRDKNPGGGTKRERRTGYRTAELLPTTYETPQTWTQTRKCCLGTQKSPANGRAFKLWPAGTVICCIK